MKRQVMISSSVGLSLISAVALSGCAGKNDSPDLTGRVDALEKQVAVLQSQTGRLQQLESKVADLQKAPSPAATTDSSTQKEETVSTPASVANREKAQASPSSFNDVHGAFGEKAINDLVKIGVIEVKSPNFGPTKPITRAEFIEWLVKANNAIRPADKAIRLPEGDEKPSFSDLKTDNPRFKYIQAMADAGWSVGFRDKTFRPDKTLTREEMICTKRPMDSAYGTDATMYLSWNDRDKISPDFRGYMAAEGFNKDVNWNRIFGNTKSCNPQKSVSRAEAAVCVSVIDDDRADKPRGTAAGAIAAK